MYFLGGFSGSLGEDGWSWNLEEGGVFTVKSSYLKLERLLVLEEERSGLAK
jgi:hypothetical protein